MVSILLESMNNVEIKELTYHLQQLIQILPLVNDSDGLESCKDIISYITNNNYEISKEE